MRMALTVKQIKEEYGITRYVLMKCKKKGIIKLHRPNGKDYLILRDEIERAIKSS